MRTAHPPRPAHSGKRPCGFNAHSSGHRCACVCAFPVPRLVSSELPGPRLGPRRAWRCTDSQTADPTLDTSLCEHTVRVQALLPGPSVRSVLLMNQRVYLLTPVIGKLTCKRAHVQCVRCDGFGHGTHRHAITTIEVTNIPSPPQASWCPLAHV